MALGNLNAVEVKITVDDKPCDYVYMNLDQCMVGHHTFEIAVNYRYQTKTVWAVTVDEIFRETLNKPVNIVMTHIESGDTNEFDGVVTDIEVVGENGDQGTVVLYGGSPTMLLDRDPDMGVFVDYTLHNVVSETLGNTGVKVEIKNNPKLQQQIPYLARYQESSYEFIKRVLHSYGEWFYYDGKKLVVGNPMEQEVKEVTFDVELSEVKSRAGIKNLNTKYYDYDPTENSYFEETAGNISNANLAMKAAMQASEPLYPNEARLPVGRSIIGESDMTNTVRVKKSREYTSMSTFTANCKTCGIKVGEVAAILLPPTLEDAFFKDLGNFLVLEVHHKVDHTGHYKNTFKGITSQTETLPDAGVVMPVALPEPAVVVDNDDPRGQGRVKVRFMWQTESESSNWIRVQSIDAGGSGYVSKNRGFVFIPELGDQVMVGFQQGDPSRPYVAGSLFHRDNSSGAAQNNTLKTISTRSGHTIEFDDNEQENWGIIIKDRSNNMIRLNTKDKSIEISAPEDIMIRAGETISMASKNLSVNTTENIYSRAGDNMEVIVNKKLNVKANERVAYIEESSQEVTKDYDLKGEKVRIDSTKQNLELASNKTIDIQSAEKVQLF